MGYLIIKSIISFFILIAIHAPWWAWLGFAGGTFLWFIFCALSDSHSGRKEE